MPYFDKDNNEYWSLKDILRMKGESVNMSHIKDLGQKLFRMKVPYIQSPNSGARLYKKEDLYKSMPNLEAQVDMKKNPLTELKEFEDEDKDKGILKPNGTMNVIYSRVPSKSEKHMKELAEQNSMIMRYCVANGVKIDYQYKDTCLSHVFGKENRPGLYELMSDILEGRVQTVYVISPDVISPFFYEFFIGLCKMCGVNVDIISNVPMESARESVLNEVISMSELMKKRFGI